MLISRRVDFFEVSAARRLDRRVGPRTMWVIQEGLAGLFLFAGVMKLVTPMDELADQSGLAGSFMKFIGVCEVLGAAGLILPGVLRIAPWLTSVAASGLVIIMIGAVTLTAAETGVAAALFPLVVGVLCAVAAYRRGQQAAPGVLSSVSDQHAVSGNQ